MFQSILANLVERTEARWAMIAGSDGVVLETDCRNFLAEAEGVAAEYAVLFRASRKAAADTEMGELHNFLLVTDRGKVLFQALTADYFLILLLGEKAHAGKAFFELTRIMEPLEQELSI